MDLQFGSSALHLQANDVWSTMHLIDRLQIQMTLLYHIGILKNCLAVIKLFHSLWSMDDGLRYTNDVAFRIWLLIFFWKARNYSAWHLSHLLPIFHWITFDVPWLCMAADACLLSVISQMIQLLKIYSYVCSCRLWWMVCHICVLRMCVCPCVSSKILRFLLKCCDVAVSCLRWSLAIDKFHDVGIPDWIHVIIVAPLFISPML